MENPLLDSNIINKNNRDYVLFAKVSQNNETLRILIDEMQLKLKFTSDNKAYLKYLRCELIYVLQNHNYLQMSIFYQKQQKKQKDNSSNKCQQCQQFINGECFKKCYKCNSNQIIDLQNEQQRLFCQICFSEFCKICDSYLEFFQQFPDKCRIINIIILQYLEQSNQLLKILLCHTNDNNIIHLSTNLHNTQFSKIKILMQILEFHQYIITKYQPIFIVIFYYVFLIVYLVKVFMILINFVIDKNKKRIHYYFS